MSVSAEHIWRFDNYEQYTKRLNELESNLKIAQAEQAHLEESVTTAEENRVAQDANLRAAKRTFEEQLKKQSVSSIAGRVLLLIEDLQREIYP